MNYFVFSIFVVKGFSFAGDETIYDSFEEGFREGITTISESRESFKVSLLKDGILARGEKPNEVCMRHSPF